MIAGKASPYLQATETLVHASTANSLDRYILQPGLPSDQFFGLFTADKKTPPGKDEKAKIKKLTQRLSHVGITNLQAPHIQYALNAKESDGDLEKAFDLLVLFQGSLDGIVREYNPEVKLLGAVNREGVTCYLDALLFAMFARLGSFEAMLYNTFDDEPRKRLAIVLRLWVNMLRTGKLITTDITKNLQETLAACGWASAAELKQQDTSEAFTFITEKLELPLLTLKMDIFHTGKEDVVDDHKFVNERLLEVAIPDDNADGQPITLEDCLEMYFNNRIEVRRHLERRSTMTSIRSRRSMDSNKAHAFHVETAELDESCASTPTSPSPAVPSSSLRTRHRAPSIIQERVIKEEGAPSEPSPGADGIRQPSSRRKGSIIRKEVMMPAWQFFSLIPWYTDNTPTSDAQVAAHFSSKRPILGLCLKRYSFTVNGSAVRRNTYVDIPIEIGLPHFIQDDKMEDDGPLYGNFKLSLQSVVCHRGVSVDSGHYISLVRGTAPNAQHHDPAPTTHEPTTTPAHKAEESWMRFDDLAPDRVSYVDIGQALKDESPYLLFYQVQPIDAPPASAPVPSEAPPSYYESEKKHSDLSDPSLHSRSTRSHSSRDYDAAPEAGPARPSLDGAASMDRDPPPPPPLPGRESVESVESERRLSFALTDGSGGAGLRPDAVTPGDEPAGSSWRLSRRGSVFGSGKSGSKSRPTSQSGENRISATFSRLALRLNKEKLWVPNGGGGGVVNGTVEAGPAPGAGAGAGSDEGVAAVMLDAEGNGNGNVNQKGGGGGGERRKLRRGLKDRDRGKGGTRTLDGELDGSGTGTGTGPGKGDDEEAKAPERECVVM